MLTLTLAYGLVAFTLTGIVRALPLGRWLGKKPISCDVCMSFWAALFTWGVGFAVGEEKLAWQAGLHVLAGAGLSIFFLKLSARLWPSAPPDM